MPNQPNFKGSHAFVSQILPILTPNGLAHVWSTIREYFWPDTNLFEK